MSQSVDVCPACRTYACFRKESMCLTARRSAELAGRFDEMVSRFSDDDTCNEAEKLRRDLTNMTADRNRHRARVKQLENLLHELADEVRAQRRTAAYQNSHGQPATSGRRRIDIESYLARAGIEVQP